MDAIHCWKRKNKMILSTAEWRKNNPPPAKQVPKTTPVVSSRTSSARKQPKAQNKGKDKAKATKTYREGYKIPNIQQDAMERVFQIARTKMEMKNREEARFS
ncbi:hypothetical protein O181_002838 [Austropuccinia psidii MF-1]|uniref:Uncharacterized protein n=1 Tax=Austropuccinia psidii MF-1 TaxID=1389203 RepID=A0A9Q3BDH5_9BASI|nr:hypothetical protein [Austropuccinia psidii MF-1]